jgi:pimeloyl-ACP methyl ester carboxylesterase
LSNFENLKNGKMERIIKGISIAVFMLIAFSCFAITKNLKGDIINNNKDDIDVIIKSGDIQIGGTLTLPINPETSSLVIMSSGSGDQDRDETLEGFKIFKVIADHLAAKGIASFRYDDRGVGTSTGDFVNSTIDDHSIDLENIMDYFKASEAHAFNDFILFGHSQGGIVAATAAVGNESVKKVILMGAPAVPLVEVVLYQLRQEHKQAILHKSLIEENVSAHNRLMRAIGDNKKVEDALDIFQESTKSILFELSSSEEVVDSLKIEQEARAKTMEFKIIYALPSLTSFLYYDPSGDYRKLKVPVLGLFGGLDFQVTIDQNKDRMENALLNSGSDYHFITFENANHFFQKATTGSRDEYGKLEKKFVADFLDEISKWIIGC